MCPAHRYNRWRSIPAILVFLLIPATLFAADPAVAAANADRFGMFTLLPPLVAITLAFITRNVVISLFTGIFSGTFMLSLTGSDVFNALTGGFTMLTGTIIASMADDWNAGIILQCLAIGGLIALVSKMGGTKAIAAALAKRAKTAVSTQIVTWLMGLLIFFDDYANSLTVGPIMRPVTDRMKISREKLSFIIDATAAPIAGIALISTWVAYEVGLIKDGLAGIGLDVNAYGVFVETIPFRFYNILILFFIVMTAVTLKEFGPMFKAEHRARTTGKVMAPGSNLSASHDMKAMEPDRNIPLSVWNAIIPIGTLIFGAFLGFYLNGKAAIMGGDNAELIALLKDSPFGFTAMREAFGASDASIVLFQAALFAGIVAVIMGVAKKIFTFEEAVSHWIHGVKSLIITGVILLLAWSLSSVIKELGTAKFLILILSDKIPVFILPSIIFILGSFISFATGTSYGTMGILMPLAIPLAWSISPEYGYLLMNVGAVLTGAIFGDHCSPISDTTILSSMGASCDHIDHVKTQIFYAITVGVITVVFGYIPVGLGLPVYIVLPIGLAVVAATVHFAGKRVDQN
ncbi:MAG: Na+/H+ antiporter NhaC family protein [Desulfobacterales bacterium]|nr:Na+/H+ antiporter NhaC family protein [Desulfobacterales bacterium]